MTDKLRRIYRIRAIAIGPTIGLLWLTANYTLDVQEKIADSEILPFYAEATVTYIFLPMLLGAVATATYMLGMQRARQKTGRGCLD
jgi:hypothetical protein